MLKSIQVVDWERLVRSLSFEAALDQGSIMSAEECVEAALAGLDQAEPVTLPSVEDLQLWGNYDTARMRLYAASQIGRSASRYHVAK